MESTGYLDTAVNAVLALLTIALFVALIRLVRGPSLPDRVIALELMATFVLGTSVVYAIKTGQTVFVDVAIALSVTAFLGTVAFALYLEKRIRGS